MPIRDTKIKKQGEGGIVRLRKKLRNPDKLLEKVGKILLRTSRKAFREQKLGTILWEPRYPGREPFINVAGVVQDMSKGTTVKNNRFRRRPALIDSKTLRESLDFDGQAINKRGSFTVEVRSDIEYAPAHQQGGGSTQSISKTVRENLNKVLKRARRAKGARARKLESLGFLFQLEDLETSINARPFLGITEEASRKINKEIKKFYEEDEVLRQKEKLRGKRKRT